MAMATTKGGRSKTCSWAKSCTAMHHTSPYIAILDCLEGGQSFLVLYLSCSRSFGTLDFLNLSG